MELCDMLAHTGSGVLLYGGFWKTAGVWKASKWKGLQKVYMNVHWIDSEKGLLCGAWLSPGPVIPFWLNGQSEVLKTWTNLTGDNQVTGRAVWFRIGTEQNEMCPPHRAASSWAERKTLLCELCLTPTRCTFSPERALGAHRRKMATHMQLVNKKCKRVFTGTWATESSYTTEENVLEGHTSRDSSRSLLYSLLPLASPRCPF